MRWLLMGLLVFALGCGTLGVPDPVAPNPDAPPQVLAAGDIAGSNNPAHLTALLLNKNPDGIVLPLGDIVYPEGQRWGFSLYYDPSWGKHIGRTFPTPGNHDWKTQCAEGYYDYFTSHGREVGEPCKLWYSFDYGGWHFVSVNTNLPLEPGTEQGNWLINDLLLFSQPCTVVYGHHPRYSSGRSAGAGDNLTTFWETLEDFSVDIYLAGHDHRYERFHKQDAYGNQNEEGPVQWVIGTGGADLRNPNIPLIPNSAAHVGDAFGVLKLLLHPNSYEFEFITPDGVRDSSEGSLHNCVE